MSAVHKWLQKKNLTKRFDVTCHMSYSSCTFDENLHIHINRDLADDVGRASDTS